MNEQPSARLPGIKRFPVAASVDMPNHAKFNFFAGTGVQQDHHVWMAHRDLLIRMKAEIKDALSRMMY